VTGLLERAAKFDREDTLQVKLDKLEALLAHGGEQDREAAPFAGKLASDPDGWALPAARSPTTEHETAHA
jgi:hypothetical protein